MAHQTASNRSMEAAIRIRDLERPSRRAFFGSGWKARGDLFDGDLSSRDPFAPPCESEFHAAQRAFGDRVAPSLVLTASLYMWFRVPRRDIVASDLAGNDG
jgi:hypothetical protein